MLFNKILSLFVFSIVCGVLFGQSSNFYGNSTVNEYATSIAVDGFGNKFIGIVSNGTTQIIKRDASGQTNWVRSIQVSASNPTQNLASLNIVGDTLFGCGWLRNGSQVLGGFYFKLNASTGVSYWINFSVSSSTYYSSIQYDPLSNAYLLVGSGTGSNGNLETKVVSVSSSNGNINWQSSLNGVLFNGFGVNYLDDIMTSSKVINNKMFFVGRSYVNGASSLNMRTTLFGVDNSGNIFLRKYLNFSTANGTIDRYYGMTINYDGSDSLIIGQFGDDNCGSCTDFKMSLIKTDLFGNVAWSKSYDVSGGNNEILHELCVTDNGYLLMGKVNLSSEAMVFIKTDKQGNLVQSKKLNISGYTGIIANNNYYVGGAASYSNGISYFVGGVNNGNANLNDALVIGLNNALEDVNNCLQLSPITVTQSALAPYSENITFAALAQTIGHSAGVQTQIVPTTNCSLVLPNVVHYPNCYQDSIVLNGLPGTYTVTWSDGFSGLNHVVTSMDTLVVTILNPATCCSVSDTIIPDINLNTFDMDLPSDTTVCLANQSYFTISPTVNNVGSSESFAWNTGLTGTGIPAGLNINVSGQYVLSISNQCYSESDTINVQVNSFPEIIVDSTYEICQVNLPYTINPSFQFADSVEWSSGSTSPSYSVFQSETITVFAYNECGQSSETISIQVNQLPTISLPVSIDTCLQFGQTITVSANDLNSDLTTWSNGDVGSISQLQSSGIYWVTAANTCGIVSDTISLIVNEFPQINIDSLFELCDNELPFAITPAFYFTDSIGWSNGSADSTYITFQSETISVFAYNECGQSTQSITIQVNEIPSVSMSPSLDTCLLQGQGVNLFANDLNSDLTLWSNGDTGSNTVVQSSGVYWVTATNVCGFASDTISVTLNYFPWLNLPDFIDTCFDSTGFILTVNDFYGNIIWNNSTTGNAVLVQDPGYVYCSVSNSCGVFSDSILVVNSSIPGTLISEDSLRLCDRTYNLSMLLPDWVINQNWYDPQGNPMDSVIEQSGWHYIIAESECGDGKDSIYIDFIGDLNFYMPNAFIPDNDGLNDVYDDLGTNYTIEEISIYNRWGELILFEKGGFSGWDGTYKGLRCPDGIYLVKLILVDCAGLEKEEMLHVNLLR